MKILHVITSARSEGTPRLVLDLLNVPEHQQDVLILDNRRKDLWEEFETATQGKLYSGDTISVKGIFSKYKNIEHLVKSTIQKSKPEMVIAWPTGFSHVILKTAKKEGINKLIAHVGNPAGNNFKERYVYSYYIFTMLNKIGAKAICCSNYLKESYQNIPLVPARVFHKAYNTIRFNRFSETSSELQKKPLKCSMVATLEKHKDHETLLKAWVEVEKRIPEVELQLIGDGSLRPIIEKEIRDLNLKSIKLLGSRKDVPKLLAQSSFFVFSTTTQEGFGTVLLEAMASKNMIIASNVPACAEVLQNGKYGVLFPPKNVEALSKILIKSLLDGINQTMVGEAYEYAATFTPQNMLNEYITIAKL